jgi:hypothetical protein
MAQDQDTDANGRPDAQTTMHQPRSAGIPAWAIVVILLVVLAAFMRSRRSHDDVPDWVKKQLGVQDTRE